MLGESGDRKTILDIFRTMAYNENQLENFSSILNWIGSRRDTLASIVNGKPVDFDISSGQVNFSTFIFQKKEITVVYFNPESLKKIIFGDFCGNENEISDGGVKGIQKLKVVVETKGEEFCLAESIGSQIPLWQLQHYDLPNWKNQMDFANEIQGTPFPSGNRRTVKRLVLVSLNHRRDSTTATILQLLVSLLQTEEDDICLGMKIVQDDDLRCFLPAVYLIDAVNKAQIRKAPIDLILLDRFSNETWEVLKEKSDQVLFWGTHELVFDSHQLSLSRSIVAGVFSSQPDGKVRQGSQYVLDSSADSQTAVDSIVTDLWASGTRVNRRSHALLFVHQSIYQPVIGLFRKQIAQLRLADDLGMKCTDFVRRRVGAKVNVKKFEEEDVKTIPDNSDFTLPTVVYDVGTSSKLLTELDDGNGHILFLIAFRNNSELFSLANTFGQGDEIVLFTSDLSSIGEISKNVKGLGIWVNRTQLNQTLPRTQGIGNWTRLGPSEDPKPPNFFSDSSVRTEEFEKALVLSQKAFTTWSSMGNEARCSTVVRVLLTALNADPNITETEIKDSLDSFLRVAGRIGTEESDGDVLLAHQYKPWGVIVILMVNAEHPTMTTPSTFLSILMSAVKGNTVLVISVGPEPLSSSLTGVQACNKIFSSGVVQFLYSTTISEALGLVSHHGKVPLVWIIHPRTNLPKLTDIPKNSFCRILVDDSSTISTTIQKRTKFLEISTTVYL